MKKRPAWIVSADWSRQNSKRSVHVVDVGRRRIRQSASDAWDFDRLLELARSLSPDGPVLVAVDLALGVPAGYLAAVGDGGAGGFLAWLATQAPASELFDPVTSAAEWRPDRPFFRVPPGRGSLTAFDARVAGGLRRRIDRQTGAKPLFAVSGIPGSVGAATRSLWRELIPRLTAERDFAVWPFDGALELLLERRSIVLAESYPALAYGAALADELPTRRLLIAKTRSAPRRDACRLLARSPWVRDAGVDPGDLDDAGADEDAFDSLFVAAGILRCLLERRPLVDPARIDPAAEGGMLLAGPVDPARRARRLRLTE